MVEDTGFQHKSDRTRGLELHVLCRNVDGTYGQRYEYDYPQHS